MVPRAGGISAKTRMCLQPGGPVSGTGCPEVFYSQEEKAASGRSGAMAQDEVFSLNPNTAPPRLPWISGEASHLKVVISQLGLSGRCWSRTKVGKSQGRIRERGWERPNLTCDCRLWLSLVTSLPGFLCVSRQDAGVAAHSGAQLALAGISLASHTHLAARDQ